MGKAPLESSKQFALVEKTIQKFRDVRDLMVSIGGSDIDTLEAALKYGEIANGLASLLKKCATAKDVKKIVTKLTSAQFKNTLVMLEQSRITYTVFKANHGTIWEGSPTLSEIPDKLNKLMELRTQLKSQHDEELKQATEKKATLDSAEEVLASISFKK